MTQKLLSCFAVCMILCCPIITPASSAHDPTEWTVNDITHSLSLVSIEEQDSLCTMTLKNRSMEVITAVALSFREGVYHYQDWLNAETSGLAPGHTFDVTAGPEDAVRRQVRISAVIFEDGSGKGDPAELDLMTYHRFGQILEGARVGAILRDRTAALESSGIDKLVERVGHMPVTSEDALRSVEAVDVSGIFIPALKRQNDKLRTALLWGVSATRERALRQLDHVKLLPVSSDDEAMPSRTEVLSFIREQYENQHSKAVALLARMKGRQQ